MLIIFVSVFEDPERTLDAVLFKELIVSHATEMFGLVGCCNRLDLLSYQESLATGILRVHQSDLVQLWASMTLCSFFSSLLTRFF